MGASPRVLIKHSWNDSKKKCTNMTLFLRTSISSSKTKDIFIKIAKCMCLYSCVNINMRIHKNLWIFTVKRFAVCL